MSGFFILTIFTFSSNSLFTAFQFIHFTFSSDISTLSRITGKATQLLIKYKNVLKQSDFEKAAEIKTELHALMKTQVDADPRNMRAFAENLREKKSYFKSLAVFDVAAVLSTDLKPPKESMSNMERCVQGMMSTCVQMLQEDATMKVLVRDHVIPLMRNALHLIDETRQASKKCRCLYMSWVLAHIEYSQFAAGLLEERERTLRKAISEMKDVFGSVVIKDHGRLFGRLVHNLGHVCQSTSRFNEAATLFTNAANAFKAAVDYTEEQERERDLKISEKSLKKVRRKLT